MIQIGGGGGSVRLGFDARRKKPEPPTEDGREKKERAPSYIMFGKQGVGGRNEHRGLGATLPTPGDVTGDRT